MTFRTWILSAAFACALAGPALAAREPYSDLFFVKHGGTAPGMLADRDACRTEALALNLGSSASAYSNPQYGALAAMGAALDSDALHSGGLMKRMQRAALIACMHRLGWQEKDLGPDDREVRSASAGKPQALEAWLRTNEPPPPAPDSARQEAKAEAKDARLTPQPSAEPPAYVKAAAKPAPAAPAGAAAAPLAASAPPAPAPAPAAQP